MYQTPATVLEDFSGGLITKGNVYKIEKKQTSDCLNVFSDLFKSLQKRLGYSKLNSSTATEQGDGLYNYVYDEITQYLLGKFGAGLKKMDETIVWDVVYDGTSDYEPDNASQANKWTKTTASGTGSPTAAVEADTDCINAKRLKIDTGTTTTDTLFYLHETAGDTWVDSVSNATGYIIEARLKIIDEGAYHSFTINCYDGTYYWILYFKGSHCYLSTTHICKEGTRGGRG